MATASWCFGEICLMAAAAVLVEGRHEVRRRIEVAGACGGWVGVGR